MSHPPEDAPPPPSRTARIAPLAAGLCAFALPLALYLRTLCPGIHPGDSAELVSAAFSLGVPHPTGYPLFMLLGHAWIRLLPGSAAFSMNLLTALFGALACLGACRLQIALWRIAAGPRFAESPACHFAAGAVAVALGAASAWWDQSNQTEVYSLLLVFVTFAWTLALRVIERPDRGGLGRLALLSGLGFTHHLLFLITLPLSAAAVLAVWRAAPRHRPRIAGAAILFLLPLALYLYLPVRAAQEPPVNIGNPRGLAGILWHLGGGDYRATRILNIQTAEGFHRVTLAELPDYLRNRGRSLLEWAGRQWQPPDPRRAARGPVLALLCLLLAAIGLHGLGRAAPTAALGLAAGFLLNLLVVTVYTIPDIEAYQIPLWLLVAVLAPLGGVLGPRFLSAATPDGPARRTARRALLAGGVALALGGYSAWAWSAPALGIDKSASTNSSDYARALLNALPPRAVLFTGGDYDIYPLWYARICEGRRPDVAVIGANFVFSPWYAAMLRSTLPPGVEVFVGDEPPSTLDRWLVAWLGGMVAPQIQAGRPVFTTIAGEPETRAIRRNFELRPAFAVPDPRPGVGNPPAPVFEIRDPNNFAPTARRKWRELFAPAPR